MRTGYISYGKTPDRHMIGICMVFGFMLNSQGTYGNSNAFYYLAVSVEEDCFVSGH